jgi:hypothetical protein
LLPSGKTNGMAPKGRDKKSKPEVAGGGQDEQASAGASSVNEMVVDENENPLIEPVINSANVPLDSYKFVPPCEKSVATVTENNDMGATGGGAAAPATVVLVHPTREQVMSMPFGMNAEQSEAYMRFAQTHYGSQNPSQFMKMPLQFLSQPVAHHICATQVDTVQPTVSGASSQPIPTNSKSNQVNNNGEGKSTRTRVYPTDYKGRFTVYIRESEVPLSPVAISKYLCNEYNSKILEITKVHKFKIRVEASDANTANGLVKDANLTKKYRVSIPADEVEINGVVDLPDVDPRDLVESGHGLFTHPEVPRVKIVHAFRLQKATLNQKGETVFKNSDLVRVTFSGKALPKKVVIFGLRADVRMFIPRMMHCDKCLGYNHTSKYCSSPSRCAKCGERHETASCQSQQIKCFRCGADGGHTNGEICPTLLKRSEKLEKKVNIKSKKAYTAMRREVNGVQDDNYYSSLSEESGEEDEIPWSQVAAGARPKRPRPSGKKSKEPPAKKLTVANPPKPDPQNKREHKKRSSQNANRVEQQPTELAPWAVSLRARAFNFVESFELSQFWEKIVLDILGQLLDNVLPRISSIVSSVIPALFSHGQS